MFNEKLSLDAQKDNSKHDTRNCISVSNPLRFPSCNCVIIVYTMRRTFCEILAAIIHHSHIAMCRLNVILFSQIIFIYLKEITKHKTYTSNNLGLCTL